MVSLREIRKRIHSVDNIKQIAKAMEMVAGVELYHVEKRTFHSRLFFSQMEKIFHHLAFVNEDQQYPIFEQRDTGKIGVVVIGADRGLCGSYNSTLFSAADTFLKTLPSSDVELILFGKKAVGHYRTRPWKIGKELTEWGGKITPEEVQKLTHQLIEGFLSKEYRAIWIVYTRFINLLSRQVKVERWLSVETASKKEHEKSFEEPLVEPNWEDFFQTIFPHWSVAKMQNALDESYASELAARVISMKTANKNAEEMIEKLTLVRNKVRQQDITEELIEIVTGAESLR